MPKTIPKHQPYPGTVKIITRVGRRTQKKVAHTWHFPPENDFLKYWRVVRYWAQKNNNISLSKLELLISLYSESTFTREHAKHKAFLGSFHQRSFTALLNEGWIMKFREYNSNSKQKTLYRLSHKGKNLCASIYNKVLMKEKIPVTWRNCMFKATANSTDKIYRRAVLDFNAEVEESPNYRR